MSVEGPMRWLGEQDYPFREGLAETIPMGRRTNAVLPSGSELRAENERLKNELTNQTAACNRMWPALRAESTAHAQVRDELRAENARLQAVVTRVREWRQEHRERQCGLTECLHMADLFDVIDEMDRP